MKKDILVTIPFESLVEQLFGEDRRYYVPLHPTIADVLEWAIKEYKLYTQYKIQRVAFQEISRFIDYKETTLANPRLWIYQDWYESEQNYSKLKATSEKERIADELLKKNIKIVAKAYREFTGQLNVAISEAKAYALLKGNKMASIKMLGIELSKLEK